MMGFFVILIASSVLAALRWLRVAQREHYLAGSVTRFAWRWWTLRLNIPLAVLALLAFPLRGLVPSLVLLTALIIGIGPLGLKLQGRSSPIAWTRRLKTVAGVSVGISLIIIGIGALSHSWIRAAAFIAIYMPLVIDLALAITDPFERRLARRFVDQATTTLYAINPVIVAITGSYGKTTIKNYVAHLLADNKQVVASPASFNNAAGLSRTVNEHLTPGTEVFVAEMGTYGPGEIRSLCSWVKPDVAVICAIGPVHLERMGSLEAIVSAKSEILEHAPTVVLNIDAFGLTELANRCEAEGKTVVRYSTLDHQIIIDGESITTGDFGSAHPSNVACSLAVAKALGTPPCELINRLASLPVVPHRQTVSVADSGVTVIDDTFNANPTGAAAALELLLKSGNPDGAKVLITPGMIELGKVAFDENARFAAMATSQISHLIIVGQTNKRSLLAGAVQVKADPGSRSATVMTVPNRDKALAWVRTHLGSGDAVLWENDLPDHFP